MGMTEDLIKTSIFSPANMYHNTGTSNEKGTGLGLKLCKEFIEKNQGRIWAGERKRKGATFYISLPKCE
jgi:K+-sensing histidine kinase KdpD